MKINEKNRFKIRNISTSKVVMSGKFRLQGSKYIENYTFDCGNIVPVYEVSSLHALNQLIGYAKFRNQAYGNVFYRGECQLHKSLLPSLYRGRTSLSNAGEKLNSLINALIEDKLLIHSLKLENQSFENKKIIIEGVLQHYGAKTRNIDIVDNHWVSLWMGLHKCESIKQINTYSRYKKREYTLHELILLKNIEESSIYQYILLMAIPDHRCNRCNGIYISNEYVKVDLRQALPSYFLRPHAQHGLVVKKIVKNASSVNDFDLADSVVGILKIRIDISNKWLGEGELLTQENLFPPAAFDQGYDILLCHSELFERFGFSITRYV